MGDKVTLGIRPEHFIDAREGSPQLVATARVVEQLGGVSYIYAGGADGVQVTVQQKGHSKTAPGTEVRIGVDPETVPAVRQGREAALELDEALAAHRIEPAAAEHRHFERRSNRTAPANGAERMLMLPADEP